MDSYYFSMYTQIFQGMYGHENLPQKQGIVMEKLWKYIGKNVYEPWIEDGKLSVAIWQQEHC